MAPVGAGAERPRTTSAAADSNHFRSQCADREAAAKWRSNRRVIKRSLFAGHRSVIVNRGGAPEGKRARKGGCVTGPLGAHLVRQETVCPLGGGLVSPEATATHVIRRPCLAETKGARFLLLLARRLRRCISVLFGGLSCRRKASVWPFARRRQVPSIVPLGDLSSVHGTNGPRREDAFLGGRSGQVARIPGRRTASCKWSHLGSPSVPGRALPGGLDIRWAKGLPRPLEERSAPREARRAAEPATGTGAFHGPFRRLSACVNKGELAGMGRPPPTCLVCARRCCVGRRPLCEEDIERPPVLLEQPLAKSWISYGGCDVQ